MDSPEPEELFDRPVACSVCGDTIERGDAIGRAETYLWWPEGDSREDGPEKVPVCQACVLATGSDETPPSLVDAFHPEDRDHVSTCDRCGTAGLTNNARRAGHGEGSTYRRRGIMTWKVRLKGLSGQRNWCLSCTPCLSRECVRQSDREYLDEASVVVQPDEVDASVNAAPAAQGTLQHFAEGER